MLPLDAVGVLLGFNLSNEGRSVFGGVAYGGLACQPGNRGSELNSTTGCDPNARGSRSRRQCVGSEARRPGLTTRPEILRHRSPARGLRTSRHRCSASSTGFHDVHAVRDTFHEGIIPLRRMAGVVAGPALRASVSWPEVDPDAP